MLWSTPMRCLFLLLALPIGSAQATDYFACADTEALLRGPDALAEALGPALATSCRRTQVRGVDTLNCELARPQAAFGLPAVEISASVQQAGTRRLSFVFKAGLERVRAAAERRLGVRFADDLRGLVAGDPSDPRRTYRLAERDDGATQLACEVAGDPLVDLGGTLEGRLAYEGAGKGTTRVCAIPVDDRLPLRCTELPPRLRSFRISGLPAAEYFLAAYPLEHNPQDFVAAYAKPLRDCSDQPEGCVAAIIVPITVKTGQTELGIRIEQRFAQVPPRVGRVREGR
jgi:hypothetical protein